MIPKYQENCKGLLQKHLKHRKTNEFLIEAFPSRVRLRVLQCGSYVGLSPLPYNPELPHVVAGNYCRERLCAVCGWRRSVRWRAQMRPVIAELEQNYKLIKIELTIRNCQSEDLSKTIDILFEGWKKLRRMKAWRQFAVGGEIRALECSYNETENTYHPHFHVCVAAKSDYSPGKLGYIGHSDLIEMWRLACGVDYNPSVRIQSAKNLIDTVKYALKPYSAKINDREKAVEVLQVLGTGLHGRRLITATGEIQRLRATYGFEEGGLTDGAPTPQSAAEITYWEIDPTGGLYTFVKRVSLTEKRREAYDNRTDD